MAWSGEDSNAEWVRDDVVPMSPISDEHQELAAFLQTILRIYARRNALGVVRYERFVMRLKDVPSAREPDILFVSTANKNRLKNTYLDGPADLVIEVINLESRERDRGAKFYEYERGGVPEYWVIDPLRQEADFYILDESERYRQVPVAEDGYFYSHSLKGFRLNPVWLWEDPLPDELEILALVVTKGSL